MILARHALAALIGLAPLSPVLASEDFAGWPILVNPFPSTGGGGFMIDGYAPQIVGATCVTDFQAIAPDGARFFNAVTFDAAPAQGGTLCANARWRALDGSASGTSPIRLFIRDGVVRRSP